MPSRSLLAALLAALALLPGALSGTSEREDDDARRGEADVTGFLDRTYSIPLAAPVPSDAEGIGPGALLLIQIEGSTYLCTANFVWRAGGVAYLGAAGHCFLPEEKTATHGPGADYDASGVRTRVCISICRFGGQLGFTLHGPTAELGEVAYARQNGAGGGVGNDFGLVRIPDEHLHLVRTDIPVWGQPTSPASLRAGDVTCHYGNAAGFGETFVTKARLGTGIPVSSTASWRAAIPSFQGDSGAAVATCQPGAEGLVADRAIGILTHITGTGIAGTTMARAQQMATEAGLAITPALG